MPHPDRPPRPLLLLLALALTACEPGSGGRLDAIATLASTNQPAAAARLNADWASGRLTMDEAITLAHDLLDAGDARGPAFAGTVLQTIEDRIASINTGGEFEIFWRRVGRLAFKAALAYFQAEQFDQAARWAFAGTTRWQTDLYWLKYTDHDALASYCLARTGRAGEAVQRLRDRPSLDGDAAEALRVLTTGRTSQGP